VCDAECGDNDTTIVVMLMVMLMTMGETRVITIMMKSY